MPPSTIDTLPYTLGAFTLTSILRDTPDAVVFSAVQTLVDREAEVVVLKPCAVDAGKTSDFVSDARAKVAAHYEAMSEVFEASEQDGMWYVAQERLAGTPLSRLAEKQKRLTMVQILGLLRTLADAATYFEKQNISIEPLRLDMIYLTPENTFTFVNPVRHGQAEDDEARKLMIAMGTELEALRPVSQPGQTRVATLCAWMREGCEGELLSWEAVRTTVEEIEGQMGLGKNGAGSATSRLLPEATLHLREGLQTPGVRRTGRIAALAAVLLVGASGLVWLLTPSRSASAPVAGDAKARLAPARIVLDSGTPAWLSVRPVTVGEYARFLEALPTLSEFRLKAIREGIPENVDFHPKDWELMYEMASKERMWKGRDISLASPVTNIDYWSALACARYMRGRLPVKEELDKMAGNAAPEHVRQTPGIREWSSTFERRGAMFEPAYVILNSPGKWDYERDPSSREADLGFRVAYDRQLSL